MDECIDLSNLSPEEMDVLKEVIKRDKALQKREETRVEKLEKQLQSVWKPGNFNANDQCFYCGEAFNVLFNPRSTCTNCLKEMCRKCTLEYKKQSCKLCKSCDAKNCFILKSGEWKTHYVNKRERNGSRVGIIQRSASDILSASIRRHIHPRLESPKRSLVPTATAGDTLLDPPKVAGETPTQVTNSPPLTQNDVSQLPRESLRDVPVPQPRRSTDNLPKQNGLQGGIESEQEIPIATRQSSESSKVATSSASISSTPPFVNVETKPSAQNSTLRRSIDKHRVKISETEAVIIPDSRLYSPSSPESDEDIGRNNMIPSFGERVIVPRNGESVDGGSSNLSNTRYQHSGSLLSVYSETEDSYRHNMPIAGEIIFELTYFNDLHIFIVNIEGARNIPYQVKETMDLYVKTYLLPDKTQPSKRKTVVKRHSANPIFNEKLEYFYSEALLRTRTLSVALWGRQKFQHNICLGEVTLPLSEWDFTVKPNMAYPLQGKVKSAPVPDSISSTIIYKGDLVFSLKYTTPNASNDPSGLSKVPSPGELQIWIKEAKNLITDQSNVKPDAFVKLYLLPDRSAKGKRKTQVIRRTQNPPWNAMIRYSPISIAELKNRCLEISLWNYGRFKTNEFLGGLRLNIGTGVLANGESVSWMQGKGPSVTMWESMLEKPDVWVDGALLLQANID